MLQDALIAAQEYVLPAPVDTHLIPMLVYAISVDLDALSVVQPIPTAVLPAMMDSISQELLVSNVIFLVLPAVEPPLVARIACLDTTSMDLLVPPAPGIASIAPIMVLVQPAETVSW